MKKAELVAQLEAAKALTSVVSIDNIVALIQQLEAEQVETTSFQLNEKSFNTIMNIIDDTVCNISHSDAIDFDSAEFELQYDNRVELTDVTFNADTVVDEIRSRLERIVEDDEEESEE